MAKVDRILDYFPSYYGATNRTKNLYEVSRMLAKPLEEADTLLFRIQRAHRLRVAEFTDDLVKLAAALNLTDFHFEDILTDEALDYGQKLSLMRSRIHRIAMVHLTGLGTPAAVMEAAAIFLNATITPDAPGRPLINHVDGDGFSHRVTIEFDHLPEKPREQIYLHDNPIRRQKVEPVERWQLNSWAAENSNAKRSPLRFLIEGVSDHTVLPSIFCPDTGEGVLFNGFIPNGKTLVVDHFNGATLDNLPVDDWLIYFKGGIFDFAGVNGTPFIEQRGKEIAPFDGNLENVTSTAFRQPISVPHAPSGRSQWHFKVAEGVYDGSSYDFAVFTTPSEPVGVFDNDFNFDTCVFDYAGGAIVGMAWDERLPCCFKLVLPANVPRPKAGKAQPGAESVPAGPQAPPPNYLSRIGNILPRFKAAGIQAFVDTAKDAWILGQSIVRDEAASGGESVAVHSTTLRNQNSDILVPLNPVQ
jgi:hypothetical protein